MIQEILLKKKKFVVESQLAEHPDHSTYVCVYSGVHYMVRVFQKDYEQVLADYKKLRHAGIEMAKIAFHDDDRKVIAFDYFPEPDCLEELSKGPLDDEHFRALFFLYRMARLSKVGLDWQPQNFMLRGSQMFYLPIKVRELSDETRLEKNGLQYWFHGKDCLANLERKGYKTDGLPHLSDPELNKKMALIAVKYY